MTYSQSLSLFLLLGLAATAVAQGNQVQQQPSGISTGQPTAAANQLEIHQSEQVAGQARLQFEGGVPGNPAVLFMSSNPVPRVAGSTSPESEPAWKAHVTSPFDST